MKVWWAIRDLIEEIQNQGLTCKKHDISRFEIVEIKDWIEENCKRRSNSGLAIKFGSGEIAWN
jgi:hypothetical protein